MAQKITHEDLMKFKNLYEFCPFFLFGFLGLKRVNTNQCILLVFTGELTLCSKFRIKALGQRLSVRSACCFYVLIVTLRIWHCTKHERFPWISSVNVTKSAGNCVFGRNRYYNNSAFVQCVYLNLCLFNISEFVYFLRFA